MPKQEQPKQKPNQEQPSQKPNQNQPPQKPKQEQPKQVPKQKQPEQKPKLSEPKATKVGVVAFLIWWDPLSLILLRYLDEMIFMNDYQDRTSLTRALV